MENVAFIGNTMNGQCLTTGSVYTTKDTREQHLVENDLGDDVWVDGDKMERVTADSTARWSDSLAAYWYGANGCEYIGYRKGRLIFVFDGITPLPSTVIESADPILSLEDFTMALEIGRVSIIPTYLSEGDR